MKQKINVEMTESSGGLKDISAADKNMGFMPKLHRVVMPVLALAMAAMAANPAQLHASVEKQPIEMSTGYVEIPLNGKNGFDVFKLRVTEKYWDAKVRLDYLAVKDLDAIARAGLCKYIAGDIDYELGLIDDAWQNRADAKFKDYIYDTTANKASSVTPQAAHPVTVGLTMILGVGGMTVIFIKGKQLWYDLDQADWSWSNIRDSYAIAGATFIVSGSLSEILKFLNDTTRTERLDDVQLAMVLNFGLAGAYYVTYGLYRFAQLNGVPQDRINWADVTASSVWSLRNLTTKFITYMTGTPPPATP